MPNVVLQFGNSIKALKGLETLPTTRKNHYLNLILHWYPISIQQLTSDKRVAASNYITVTCHQRFSSYDLRHYINLIIIIIIFTLGSIRSRGMTKIRLNTKYYKISWNDLPPHQQESQEAELLLSLLLLFLPQVVKIPGVKTEKAKIKMSDG